MTKKTIADLKTEITDNIANNVTGDITAAHVRGAMINMIDSLSAVSGWCSYTDTQYPTSGSPFTVLANTDTIIPNNAATKEEANIPPDIPAFYSPQSLLYDGGSTLFEGGDTVTGGTSGATATVLAVGGDATSGTLFLTGVSGVFLNNEGITSSNGSALANGTLGGGRILGKSHDGLDSLIYFKAEPTNDTQWMDIWVDIGGAVGELYRQTFSFPKGSGVERGVSYALPSAYTLGTWAANGGKLYCRSSHDLEIYGLHFNFDRTYKADI